MKKFCFLLSAAFLFSSAQLQAVLVLDEVVLPGAGGQIDIIEVTDGQAFGYFVDILNEPSPLLIYGFAVSGDVPAPPITAGVFSDWSANLYDAGAWDSGQSIGSFSTTDLGLYNDLFGSDLFAFIYWQGGGVFPITELNDTDYTPGTLDPFSADFQLLGGPPVRSSFVAFDSGGGIIDGSSFVIPEPSACIAFLTVGLLGLVVARQRRRKAVEA